jgi:hypothetical protein
MFSLKCGIWGVEYIKVKRRLIQKKKGIESGKKIQERVT